MSFASARPFGSSRLYPADLFIDLYDENFQKIWLNQFFFSLNFRQNSPEFALNFYLPSWDKVVADETGHH